MIIKYNGFNIVHNTPVAAVFFFSNNLLPTAIIKLINLMKRRKK